MYGKILRECKRKNTFIIIIIYTYMLYVYMSLVSVLLKQNFGHGVGGACSHNKSFGGLSPFPTSKRILY